MGGAAHLAALLLNWDSDVYILRQRFRRRLSKKGMYSHHHTKFHGSYVRSCRLVIVLVYMIIDTIFAVIRRFKPSTDQQVSFTAHLAGAIAGLLIGIIVLKNRKVHAWELKLKIFCIISFGFFILSCLFWNVSADG